MGPIPAFSLDPTFRVLCQRNGTTVIAIQVDRFGTASAKSLLKDSLCQNFENTIVKKVKSIKQNQNNGMMVIAI